MGIVKNLISNDHLAKKEKKDAVLSIRLSEEEKDAFLMIIEQQGISISEFLRDYIKQTILMSKR